MIEDHEGGWTRLKKKRGLRKTHQHCLLPDD